LEGELGGVKGLGEVTCVKKKRDKKKKGGFCLECGKVVIDGEGEKGPENGAWGENTVKNG